VLDPGLSLSLAGVPGRIKAFGGAYRGARWRCGDLVLEFTSMVPAPAASLLTSDETGELVFDLGDALLERTLASVSDPDWTFVDGDPATFRWSPAADVAGQTSIGVSWGEPTATVLVERPITHVDPATFSIPLPPGAGTSLWFTVPVFRSCGESCTLSIWSQAWHTATLTPP
jgi:hypothetical protein